MQGSHKRETYNTTSATLVMQEQADVTAPGQHFTASSFSASPVSTVGSG